MSDRITENEKRGFEILTRNLKRRFPFIIDVTIKKETDYWLWFQLKVEFFKFIKFYDVKPTEHYIDYGVKEIKDYFESYPTMNYPFGMVSKDEYAMFGNEYLQKLKSIMNLIYKNMPKKY